MNNDLMVLKEDKRAVTALLAKGDLSIASEIQANEFLIQYDLKKAELEQQKVENSNSGLLNLNDVAQSLNTNEEFTVSVKRQSLSTKNSQVEINQSQSIPLGSIAILIGGVALLAALVV
jgi:hypothetical protein